MSQSAQLREGMEVYGADGRQVIGKIERVHGNGFDMAGKHYSMDQVESMGNGRIRLRGAGAGMVSGQQENEIRVPVAEERLSVGKRDVDLGAATIRKTVTEEEQTVPVTLVN